ncbi:VWA domain-containing protein [Calditrichota bacterium GD2]
MNNRKFRKVYFSLLVLLIMGLTNLKAQQENLPYMTDVNSIQQKNPITILKPNIINKSQKTTVVSGNITDFALVVNINDRNISIVDTKTNAVNGPFLTGQLGSSGELLDVAITPDNNTALVSNFGENKIYFIDIVDLANPVIKGSVDIGFSAEDIAIAPSGKYAIVTDGGSSTYVASIEISSMTLVTKFDLSPNHAQAVAIAPDGQNVLIADYDNSQIIPLLLDPNTGDLQLGNSGTIQISGSPLNIGISPQGNIALVPTTNSGMLDVLDIQGIDQIQYSGSFLVREGLQSIVFNKDGSKAFVVSYFGSPDSLFELKIDQAGSVTKTGRKVGLLSDHNGGFYGVDVVAVSNDGNWLYVGNPSSSSGSVQELVVINLNSMTIESTIQTGDSPVGIASGSKAQGGVKLVFNQIDASAFPNINCYVTVTDSVGNSISGLTESNFLLKEDNYTESPITVTSLGGTNVPISVSLVIDRSGSMAGQQIDDAKTAAKDFVDQMNANDEAAIISFSTDVTIDQDFTSDKDSLYLAIDGIVTGGNTAIYDASIEAVNLTVSQSGRKAVILMTDGLDNSSNYSLQDAIDNANNANIPIYTIGLGISPGSVEEQNLQQLAQQTGGEYYYAPSSSDLQQIYQDISNQLQNQYQITYTTHNQKFDGSTRTVEIKVDYQGETDSKTKTYVAPRANNAPVIVSIQDVPHDQGGKVLITWLASGLDLKGIGESVEYYSIWRAIPLNNKNKNKVTNFDLGKKTSEGKIRIETMNDTTIYWEWIASQPAHCLPKYSYAAETLYDSMSTTQGWHYFFISAHTSIDFYDSAPDSGYSIDNLAPEIPKNVIAEYRPEIQSVHLIWDENNEPDLKHYNIFRQKKGSNNWQKIGSTTETEFFYYISDVNSLSEYEYSVNAEDIHENVSKLSDPVGVITSLEEFNSGIPENYSLKQNYPNPFNPTTNISFCLPHSDFVQIIITNSSGKRIKTLFQGRLNAGSYNLTWDATDAAGKPVASGIYFYQLRAGNVVKTKKMILMR